MGQRDICNVLKEQGTWLNSRQLSQLTGMAAGKVSVKCDTLVRFGFLEHKIESIGAVRRYWWRSKSRNRINGGIAYGKGS